MSEEITHTPETTGQKIIRAAHDLFVQQGYHGTSMRQIAEQAGIALGGLYNHFSSKGELFEAVFWEYHPYKEVLPVLLDLRGDTIEERVSSAAAQMVKAIQERPDFLNLMFIEVVEFKSQHALEVFTAVMPHGFKITEGIVGDEQQRLRPIPVPMLIRSFLGLFFSYFLTEIMFSHAAPQEFRENAMLYMVDIYLHGVLADQKTM